jgi:hypothetical protein
MSTWIDPKDPLLAELKNLDASLVEFTEGRDSATQFLSELPQRYSAQQVATLGNEQRTWEVVGLLHLNTGRTHEALAIFWCLYQHMLGAQSNDRYVHKGLLLVWIAECFAQLNFPLHAMRYLMLTLCEDALRQRGVVSPDNTGIYFRLVWRGLPDSELRRYAARFYELSQKHPREALFPEALLQRVDHGWVTEFPSASEASSYWVNPIYVRHHLDQLGDGTGEALEILAEYLMSCMPGCRTMRRRRSGSTDYDIVCSIDGFELDFRSELGRYFVNEGVRSFNIAYGRLPTREFLNSSVACWKIHWATIRKSSMTPNLASPSHEQRGITLSRQSRRRSACTTTL